MSKNLIKEAIAAAPNRRRFLQTLGVATAGVTAMTMGGVLPASAATNTEVEVLNFALNLEYLESEFYTYAIYGKGIETQGIGVNGNANGANPAEGGKTTGGKKVNFEGQSKLEDTAIQIGSDERAHVTLLRSLLGQDKIAKPDLNLSALGLNLANVGDFLRQARIFEDIGVSAYAGAAGLLTTPAVITYAARILAAEAEHTSTVRTALFMAGLSNPKLDGADLLPPPSGANQTILSINPKNGLPAVRTPGQVLYLAFNAANVSRGGFFPTGVNGAITTSTAPATASNLS